MAITQEHLDRAVALAKQRGATRVVLFGSAAEKPEEARDLDLAIAGVPGWTFFKLAAEMERELRVPLDVIPLDGADGQQNAFAKRVDARGRVLYQA